MCGKGIESMRKGHFSRMEELLSVVYGNAVVYGQTPFPIHSALTQPRIQLRTRHARCNRVHRSGRNLTRHPVYVRVVKKSVKINKHGESMYRARRLHQ